MSSLDAARLDAAKLDAAKLDAAKLDAAKLDAARLDAARLDAARLDAARLDAAKLDAAKLDAATSDLAATLAALAMYAERWNAHPSLRSMGVSIAFPDTKRVRLAVDHVPLSMRGGLGDDAVVNGGVLSGLCDLVIGCTAGLVDPESASATVQLSIRFEQPLRGPRIEGEARLDRATSRLIFASAEICDAEGRVCVRCQGIASLLKGRAKPSPESPPA